MTVYLLDNSLVQRLPRWPEVSEALGQLVARGDLMASSEIAVLEAGFSARSAVEHSRIVDVLARDMLLLPLTPEVGMVAVDLQTAMFESGRGRAAGVPDLLQAAIALVHGAVLVHYDADYELLGEVETRLRQQWVVPRGSVD